MMSGKTVCGFRDSAYLYYPLFKWIDAQWMAGEIPLWNPYCNYGMPVVGDGSSSVFYPGKLIFFFRFLSYPSRYGIYLAMHIPIAAAGTYWLAKTLRANKAGATLAACGYAFGGSVLFQVTNVIFLVSAAWLPFAVCAVWKMVKTGSIKWALLAAVCCSMMILGGDPQMVYHVGLIAVGTILFEAFRIRSRVKQTKKRDNNAASSSKFLFKAGIQLGAMVLVTTALSAIQLLPTYQWAKRSERSTPDYPVNIYDFFHNSQPASANTNTNKGNSLFAEPRGSVEHTYQFSKEYWSVLELFWPNYSGKPFPRHRRWATFAASDRIWVPSTYMGILIAFLGVSGFRLWGPRRKNIWLTWLFLFFCLGSFGWYGAVWLINSFLSEPLPAGPQVGGLYWLLQILLPKYYLFRYPAKLFVIASLALSVLAGINLRKLCEYKFRKTIGVFAGVTLAQYLIVSKLIGSQNNADPLFGFFDTSGSGLDFAISSIQAVVILATGIAVAKYVMTERDSNEVPNELAKSLESKQEQPIGKFGRYSLGQIAIVMLALADVVFANHWMLAQVNSSVFETPTSITSAINQLESTKPDDSPIQIFRHRDLWNDNWNELGSPDRLAEVVKKQRESLYPKHHLEHNVVLIGSFSSVWPRYYEQLLTIAESENPIPNFDNFHLPPDRQLRFDALVVSGKTPALKSSFGSTKLNDPVVWIASEQSSSDVDIQVVSFRPNSVVAKFKTASQGVLAFGRIAEPGWSAKIHNQSTDETAAKKLKLDQEHETLLLAVDSPGEYEVEFRYMPNEFVAGAITSSISWVLLLLVFGYLKIHKN